MLDERVISFLTKTKPLYIHLAVVNSAGCPYSVRGYGVSTNQEKDMISIYILNAQKEKVETYLNSGNDMIACLFTNGFSNESFQLKGQFIESKAVQDKDIELLTQYRNGSLKLFPKLYAKFSPACDHWQVIILHVTEIFIQTPGPYAGQKYKYGGIDHDS